MNKLYLKLYGVVVACTLLFFDVSAQQNKQLYFENVDDVVTQINGEPYPVHVTGINYADLPAAAISLNVRHNNPELIQHYQINSTSNGNAFIQYALQKNATGKAVFTVEIEGVNSSGKRLFFKRKFNITVNSVIEEAKKSSVTANKLHIQTYPNPLAGQGTIEFSSPESDYIFVDLYDIGGRRIRQLYYGYAEAGIIYRLSLLKRQLSSGAYYLQVHNKLSKKTLKIIVSNQ